MYARVTTIPIKNAKRHEMEELASEATTVFEQLDGFQNATFLMNDDMSEVGVVSYWGTKDQATAISDTLRAYVVKELDGYLAGEPTTKIFEVY